MYRWGRRRLPLRFYDLRHTGNTLAADTGAKLKDLMVRAGQSSERAQLIYQHSTAKHQRRPAQGIDAEVRAQRQEDAHVSPYWQSLECGRMCRL